MASRKWKSTLRAPVPRHHEDAILRRQVAELLSRLPADHPARVAFHDGAPTLEAQRLIDTDPALVESISLVYQLWRVREVESMPRYFNPYD